MGLAGWEIAPKQQIVFFFPPKSIGKMNAVKTNMQGGRHIYTKTHAEPLRCPGLMCSSAARGGGGGGGGGGGLIFWQWWFWLLAGQLWHFVCQWAEGLLIVGSACACVPVCVRFTRWLWSCSIITASAAPGSRWYWPRPQSLLANSCFILWQFALMKSRRSPSDLCSLSIFNHVILIWGMS